jgi:hypothetical protein
MMTLAQIDKLPEVATSAIREMQFAIDWNMRCYAEAALNEKTAWSMYIDAVDNGDPKEEKDALYEVATMFENQRKDAYHNWQNAKAQYLTMLN